MKYICMKYRRIYLDSYSYYLTLVTQDRKPLLIDNIDVLRHAFKLSKKKYVYDIEAIVILPDHLHMIIRPKISTEYSKIVRHIKRSFVYGLSQELKDQAKAEISHAKYKGIWQEQFYKHNSISLLSNIPF